jgi:hypothetical protein
LPQDWSVQPQVIPVHAVFAEHGQLVSAGQVTEPLGFPVHSFGLVVCAVSVPVTNARVSLFSARRLGLLDFIDFTSYQNRRSFLPSAAQKVQSNVGATANLLKQLAPAEG